MTTQAISSVVGQVVQLQLQAQSEDWFGLFDRLELWRASSSAGPFIEVTAPTWLGARVPRDVVGDPPVSPPTGPGLILAGKTLSLFLNEETQVDVTFSGSDPITFAAAAAQVNLQTPLVQAFVASDGRFVVQTVEAGNKAVLRIIPTNAASLLGLPTTSPAWFNYGKDARPQLTQESDVYPITDFHSSPTSVYKTRFSNSFDGTLSDFSLPFAVTDLGIADPSLLVTGTVDLVDLRGRPVQNREVSITTNFNGTVLNGRAVVPTDQRSLTDDTGHVEFSLIRGMPMTVSVAGTKLVRDVIVPTDPAITSFSLLDPSVGSDDVFVVQVPNVDFAVRRAL